MIPDQEVERVLRDTPDRLVSLVSRVGQRCVTRVLRVARVHPRFATLVRHAVLDGRGSFAALGDDVAMTLDGYAIASRVLGPPGEPPRWARAVDAGVDSDGFVYVTTAFVAGAPMDELAAPLSDAALASATAALLAVVGELHGRGVAHGDLKLSNLVLRDDGGVSLIDLDTLREVPRPDVGAPTRDRTESWAAPEQLLRQETWLGSDLWTLARVLRELWGDRLPMAWGAGLASCRHPDPVRRPRVQSLASHLFDGGALVDHLGEPCVEPPEPAARPAGTVQTERVPAGPSTERVADLAPRAPRSPMPAAGPSGAAARVGNSGCMGMIEALGKGVAAASIVGFALVCAGVFAVNAFLVYRADRDADALMVEAKVHKTDPEHNGPTVREALWRKADALHGRTASARTCAVRALTYAWHQRWQFEEDWSQQDFDQASVVVNDPLCRAEPEALLARATVNAGACRRRAGDAASVVDCELALAAIADLWARVPPGEGWHWFRVEAAWQELRARSGLVARYVSTNNAESASHAALGFARCEEAGTWTPFAPVNGPELVEECLAVAGHVRDVPRFLRYADQRLAVLSGVPKERRRVFALLYAAGGEECAGATLSTRRGVLRVAGAPWCQALGHLARGCTEDAAVAMGEGSLGDTTHPWEALATALAATKGPCRL